MDPSRHAHNKNWLEWLAGKIPGFHGYLQREDRRESDALARKWLEQRLQQAKRGLDDRMRKLVDAGQLDALAAWERLRSRLDGFLNKIRGAERGYSGIFNFVKVDEGVLEQVYAIDMGLVESVTAWSESIEQSGETSSQVADDFLKKLDAIESSFAKRGEVLRGLGAAT